MMMLIYYEGELLQMRQYSRPDYKWELLRMFRKIYGRNFDKCEIIYQPTRTKKSSIMKVPEQICNACKVPKPLKISAI